MTNPVPLTIQAEERIYAALRLRAAREDVAVADVVNDLLRKALAAEIEEAAGVPPLASVIQEVMKTNGKGGKAPSTTAPQGGL